MKVIGLVNYIVDMLPHFSDRERSEMPVGGRRGNGDCFIVRKDLPELLEESQVVWAIRAQTFVDIVQIRGLEI